MSGNQPATVRDQREKQTAFIEIVNAEKLLWVTIQHKGISHPEVQDLYCKARSGYEKIILGDYQTVDIQEVEYSLWRLHYKHIDEYRKKIKKVSTSSESTNNLNSHVEGFKLFLSEVAEFYKDLVSKFRRTRGLSDDSVSVSKGGGSDSVELVNLQRSNYVCHRFFVCLGDLSRYMELCKKPDVQKWGAAATFYLEASSIWPHSGNPQNQLALLATYIGDEFLALYHCIRSLAVKEPFPDALDNIMLLFEKNKSSQLQSLSTDAHIDFSKPLKRLSSQIKSYSSMDSTNVNKLGANENIRPVKTDIWPLFVRMISFFLVKPSFEDLPHTFASTMKELETLLALNDIDLNSSLEPYEPFDSSRKGPYRAIQAVTILIFVVHNLIKTPKVKEPKGDNDEQSSACSIWAWTCTFTFLGHLIQRCLTFSSDNQEYSCSLLPAVLVFVEWYVSVLDYAEACSEDQKVSNAKSYFFGALVDLLSGFNVKEHEIVNSTSQTALWEDHELRGFEPVSQSNDLLDFSTHSENRRKFEAGNSIRINRIIHASVEIADRLKGLSQSPIFYDKSTRKFTKKNNLQIAEEPNAIEEEEEEEVILFKPLTRYNSEPIDQTETSEEGVRRSSSLVYTQNGSHGPPSLSGWVLNKESLNLERERGSRNTNKRELSPILEIPTSSLANMSIAETTNAQPYIAPIPSAPLLPEDPVWLRGNLSKEEHSILGAPPVSRLPNFSLPQEPLDLAYGVPGFVDAFRPPVFGLSSSEWLYRYNNNLSLELPSSNQHRPVLGNNLAGNLGNFQGYDGGPRYDLIDKWGNPLLTNRMVYFENPNQRDPSFGYQRPNIGAAGSGELRAEQPQLLQHIKEREWQLQSEAPFRGHPYTGN